MKFRKYIFLIFLFYSYMPVLAQVDTAWVRRYNGPGNGEDIATALAVDDSGNVYVTGYSTGSGTSDDYATIKYAPNGDTLWVRRYHGGNGGDYANALAVDDSGNVYVTGYSGFYPYYYYTTIKYAPNGDTLWVRGYNGPVNEYNLAFALALDGSGNVYVTGISDGGTSDDYATIKYAPNGDTLWVRRYNGGTAWSIGVDDFGNVYVTGSSYSDYATIKYYSNGDTAWVRRYNGPGNGGDGASALAVDDSGNVYVTGYSYNFGGSSSYATIKYAPNGDTLWVRRYNGPGNFYDVAYALELDENGNVYVTGLSWGSGTDEDYATIKYAPNGDTLWVRRYNGPSDSRDVATSLAVDDSGNVYVAGGSDSAFVSDYAIIKYNANGGISWVRRYNGPSDDEDRASALKVDKSRNVYVTGVSRGNLSDEDYVTIKYVQFVCLAKPGDANADGSVLLPDIVTIINFLFKSAPAPTPLCRADANADGAVLLSDIVYLINFLFKSGPAPLKSKECCL